MMELGHVADSLRVGGAHDEVMLLSEGGQGS